MIATTPQQRDQPHTPLPRTVGPLRSTHPTSLVVPMGRRVGLQGGAQGTGAALDKVTIITTDGNKIITAFPSQ